MSFKQQVQTGLEIPGFHWTAAWWSSCHSFNSSLFFLWVRYYFNFGMNHQEQSWANTSALIFQTKQTQTASGAQRETGLAPSGRTSPARCRFCDALQLLPLKLVYKHQKHKIVSKWRYKVLIWPVGSQFTVTSQPMKRCKTKTCSRLRSNTGFQNISLRWVKVYMCVHTSTRTVRRDRTCEAYQSEPTALHLIHVEKQENKWMHHRLCRENKHTCIHVEFSLNEAVRS